MTHEMMTELVKGMLTREQMLYGFIEHGLLTDEVKAMDDDRLAEEVATQLMSQAPTHMLDDEHIKTSNPNITIHKKSGTFCAWDETGADFCATTATMEQAESALTRYYHYLETGEVLPRD